MPYTVTVMVEQNLFPEMISLKKIVVDIHKPDLICNVGQ